jgi:hypothetical protein
MHIPGYLEGFRPPLSVSPLVDATSWVNDAEFWPAFLHCVGLASSAPEAFDADAADIDAYLDRFGRPESWPVFSVPVATGTMQLVLRNFPDDTGIDWFTDDDLRAALRRLPDDAGGTDPGPGLPWALLPEQPAHLLMALPAFGGHDVPDGVQDKVEQALLAIGAKTLIKELATDLLQHRACILL